ncbi:ExeM/NucH family extracellular endonuclease [Thalassotalea sp. G2M2-11]|uniref:ExeM/NucH family extracellular endonuclease n=1 Tax=Thalassotalea sp. G2M2-11 TaxID=2787627 RepID=UPI0019D23F51|nr:ExeM/NucH family extracellular endonuclease [Thalassotalea sp. G2M2-11]
MEVKPLILLASLCALQLQAEEVTNACFNCPPLDTVADASTFDDASYYADALAAVANNQTAAAIKAAITTSISQHHKVLTYSEVWTALTETDEDPANSANVILLYKGTSLPKMSNGSGTQSSDPDNWNREHVWAKSHGFSSSSNEAYTDIHHLRPTDISVNSSRGNLDFDNSDAPLSEAPSNRVDDDSFEPRDAVKGDVARMVFYMDTRYEGLGDITPDLTVLDRLTASGEAALGRLCRLLEWHSNDPVDGTEINRNNRIYEFQGNRNPFIDHPEWVNVLYDAPACSNDTGGGDTGGGDTGGGDTGGESPVATSVMISGVIDGPLSGGVPKAVELYIANDITDLSVCGIGSANNGGGTDGQEFTFPAESATAGSYLYVASEATGFEAFFGFAPDYTASAANVNGDDAIELFCNGEVVDTFGDIHTDGTGQPWEYKDGWAYRNDNTTADGADFNLNHWTFSGKDVLDGQSNNAGADTPFPSKSFTLGEPLIITGIFDGPLSGGTPKAIELYAPFGVADLSACGIGSANNGGGSDGEEFTFPAEAVAAGSYIYIATETAGFEAYFGISPDYITGAAGINGDDAVELFCHDQVIDTFGEINQDGTGQSWEYKDGWAYRNSATSNDANVFDISHWSFSGKDANDGESSNDTAAKPFPIASFADEQDPSEPPVSALGQCYDQATLIHEIQGETNISPLVDQSHVVEGVVSAVFSDLNGFFMQEELTDQDDNSLTSEGIFVYHNQNTVSPNVGDVVRVIGAVSEHYGNTQVSATEDLLTCGSDTLVASELTLPLTDDSVLETVEGMLVVLSQTLTVVNNDSLSRYGEITVASERLYNPTQIASPGEAAMQVKADNKLKQLLIDDGRTVQNADSVPYPAPELSADNSLRAGTQVAGIEGVITYAYKQYRLQPTQALNFIDANPRLATPELAAQGDLTLASFNVLNFFNGDGQGAGFPTSRGADTAEEFVRQRDKLISALLAMNADVVGLMELENDGFGEFSAIQDLVNGLNANAAEGQWAFVNLHVDNVGTDQISSGIIYRSDKVAEVGTATFTTQAPFDYGNRPPVVQTFKDLSNQDEFNLVVTHLRSKGSCRKAQGDDKDLNDGQGCWNATRVLAVNTLLAWLDTQPTGIDEADTIILGDMNAYSMEDPINTFKAAGFAHLMQEFHGDQSYSYVYRGESGSLDHAFSSPTMRKKVKAITDWHINADEPRTLDYNMEYKSDYQLANLYANNAYRASDHDPVVIALDTYQEFDVTWDNLSGNPGWRTYSFDLPAGMKMLEITTQNGSGDVQLFVEHNKKPTYGHFDCQSTEKGSTQSCVFDAPQAGTWYIRIRGGRYQGVDMKAYYHN